MSDKMTIQSAKVYMALLTDPIRDGWLLRQSKGFFGATTWVKKWYIMKNSRIWWFDSKDPYTQSKGVIDLARKPGGGYIVEIVDDQEELEKLGKQEATMFQLTHAKGTEPDILFSAEDELDMESWVQCILLEMFRESPINTVYMPSPAITTGDSPAASSSASSVGPASLASSQNELATESDTHSSEREKEKARQDRLKQRRQAEKQLIEEDERAVAEKDKDRIAKEQEAKLKAAEEKEAKDKADKEKAEKDKAEKDKAEKDKAEKDKAEKDKAEKDKAAKDKAAKEKAEQEKAEKEKADKAAAAAVAAAPKANSAPAKPAKGASSDTGKADLTLSAKERAQIEQDVARDLEQVEDEAAEETERQLKVQHDSGAFAGVQPADLSLRESALEMQIMESAFRARAVEAAEQADAAQLLVQDTTASRADRLAALKTATKLQLIETEALERAATAMDERLKCEAVISPAKPPRKKRSSEAAPAADQAPPPKPEHKAKSTTSKDTQDKDKELKDKELKDKELKDKELKEKERKEKERKDKEAAEAKDKQAKEKQAKEQKDKELAMQKEQKEKQLQAERDAAERKERERQRLAEAERKLEEEDRALQKEKEAEREKAAAVSRSEATKSKAAFWESKMKDQDGDAAQKRRDEERERIREQDRKEMEREKAAAKKSAAAAAAAEAAPAPAPAPTPSTTHVSTGSNFSAVKAATASIDAAATKEGSLKPREIGSRPVSTAGSTSSTASRPTSTVGSSAATGAVSAGDRTSRLVPVTDDPSLPSCIKCGKNLSGQVVEFSGSNYHLSCFGCAGCGRMLTNTALNIDGKPHCDGCGRKAFVKKQLSSNRANIADGGEDKDNISRPSTSTSSSSGPVAAKSGPMSGFAAVASKFGGGASSNNNSTGGGFRGGAGGKATGKEALLIWCQSVTENHRGVDVTDFSKSWADGLAFCALYHTFYPDKIPYSTLTAEDRKRNFDLAFSVGESVGVPALLDTVDMLDLYPKPDSKSIMLYLSQAYRTLREL
ncbi:paramyosin [Capsaspora owczarzaki ATCC 30864]|uniref:Paramyosin n=1 Tax=Capsaspora owczarzaki (strain ATCC 30864) TaxID=595528 RepID=A0A0D2WNJ4_CAPO3|nr:paramyosin [Capsaspora owczarzaki ATCC 30864]KJE91978.1 paramyosin [Capsaspora owczarzaki ATCC 30864]|eukprot:XP_004363860.2 paramyosin [Capsaspora owczarzaki ATCC 30864]